jgi:hypothetical protein
MWILYVLLAAIAFLLFRILRELRGFAFITAFNLTMARKVAFEKVLTDEEKERYEDALEGVRQKYPQYFRAL